MLSSVLYFILVAIAIIVNQSSSAAVFPNIPDESVQSLNRYIEGAESAVEDDDAIEKRISDRDLIHGKSKNYEMKALQKILHDMYIGKRDDSRFQVQNLEETALEGKSNPKSRFSGKGFARFIIEFDDDAIVK